MPTPRVDQVPEPWAVETLPSEPLLTAAPIRSRVEEPPRTGRELLLSQLWASNQVLESFATTLCQELRAPLRAIDGFSLALEEDCGDRLRPEGEDYLRRIRKNAQHLLTLLEDISRLARVQETTQTPQAVDMSLLAEEEVAGLRTTWPHAVQVVISPGLWAWGDESLLRTLMHALLDNAFKFTASSLYPRVEIGERNSSETTIGLFVRDNGVGFDMNDAKRLFHPFQRLHLGYPGGGLGLSLAHRVVTRHGGRIWAESVVGQGSAFHVVLRKPPR